MWSTQVRVYNKRENQRISMRLDLDVLSFFDFIITTRTSDERGQECTMREREHPQRIPSCSRPHSRHFPAPHSCCYRKTVLRNLADVLHPPLGRNSDERGSTLSAATRQHRQIVRIVSEHIRK